MKKADSGPYSIDRVRSAREAARASAVIGSYPRISISTSGRFARINSIAGSVRMKSPTAPPRMKRILPIV